MRSPGRKRVLVHFELGNKSGDDEFDIVVVCITHI